MVADRRLPTSVFVLVAAVVLGTGALWWTANEPPRASGTAPPDGGRVVTAAALRAISADEPVSEHVALERMVREMKKRR